MKIRTAGKRDAKQLLAIYAPYVRNSAVTFEYNVPSVRNFSERIIDYMKTYPWLVCEHEGDIIGYAYASAYRERAAYQWNCECSVYVEKKYQRNGIAKILYSTLFDLLRQQGFVRVYAVITSPNPASIRFHEAADFKKFAIYRKVGYKLGRWHDVQWMELQLNELEDNPVKPVAFSKIKNAAAIENIIERANGRVYLNS